MNWLNSIEELYDMYSEEENTPRIVEIGDDGLELDFVRGHQTAILHNTKNTNTIIITLSNLALNSHKICNHTFECLHPDRFGHRKAD